MEDSIEKLRLKLKIRMAIFIAVLIIALIAFILELCYVIPEPQFNNEHYSDFARGFLIGAPIGLMIPITFKLIKHIRALKNDDSVRKLFISVKDERRKIIEEKLSRIGFYTTLIILLISSVIAAYFNFAVFATLAAAAFLCAMLRFTLYLIYSKLL